MKTSANQWHWRWASQINMESTYVATASDSVKLGQDEIGMEWMPSVSPGKVARLKIESSADVPGGFMTTHQNERLRKHLYWRWEVNTPKAKRRTKGHRTLSTQGPFRIVVYSISVLISVVKPYRYCYQKWCPTNELLRITVVDPVPTSGEQEWQADCQPVCLPPWYLPRAPGFIIKDGEEPIINYELSKSARYRKIHYRNFLGERAINLIWKPENTNISIPWCVYLQRRAILQSWRIKLKYQWIDQPLAHLIVLPRERVRTEAPLQMQGLITNDL